MSDETLVPVEVACQCPGTPHDGDTVYLYPEMGLHGGILAQRKFVDLSMGNADRDEIFAGLIEVYVRNGVAHATFVDGEGTLLSREAAIELLLSRFSVGSAVADRADDLYSNALLTPLLEKVSKSSRTSQTNGSTSRKPRSSTKRPRPLKSSSTTTSQTDAIETA